MCLDRFGVHPHATHATEIFNTVKGQCLTLGMMKLTAQVEVTCLGTEIGTSYLANNVIFVVGFLGFETSDSK